MTKPKSKRVLERDIAKALGQRPLFASTSKPSSSHLLYLSIGSDGSPWPAWLRSYTGKCGVYVIRDKATHKAIYVGSSRKQLYDTITRHFQQWRREGGTKNWWLKTGNYRSPAGHDPGVTYSRARCEVAVRLVPCGEETEMETDLIAKLKPRDNMVSHPDGDLSDVPF